MERTGEGERGVPIASLASIRASCRTIMRGSSAETTSPKSVPRVSTILPENRKKITLLLPSPVLEVPVKSSPPVNLVKSGDEGLLGKNTREYMLGGRGEAKTAVSLARSGMSRVCRMTCTKRFHLTKTDLKIIALISLALPLAIRISFCAITSRKNR